MPKIDEELKARAVRLVHDHQGGYSSLTAAAAVVASKLGVGKESVRRWVIQFQVDGGRRAGATSKELAEIKPHPYTPKRNGKIERYNRILAEELLYGRPFTSQAERAQAVQAWNIHYNYHRPHTAAGNSHQPNASTSASPTSRAHKIRLPASGQ